MKEEKEKLSQTKKGVSRREFITGAVGSAAALGAMTTLIPRVSAAAPSGENGKAFATSAVGGPLVSMNKDTAATSRNWSYSSDVVVVGYGSAGAVAAITAYDAGANVLILEKTPSLASLGIANGPTLSTQISGGGGNSHICGGGAWSIIDPVQHAQWFYNMAYGATSMAVCQAWASMAAQNKAWYDVMGIPYNTPGPASYAGEYSIMGSNGGSVSLTPAKKGQQLFYALDQLVTKTRGIPVLFNTRGTALIQDPNTREVLGVQALQNLSQVVNVQAKRAVVLTTGGFEHNGLMKLNYLKCAPYHFGGWQYNTGDGINMAMAAGAGLWHMNSTSGRYAPWIPTYNMAWAIQANGKYNYIWVDRYGNRFVKETPIPSHSAWQVAVDWNFTYAEYSRTPALWVFDSTIIKAGVIAWGEGGDAVLTGINALPVQLGGVMSAGSAVGVPWSPDNSAELAAGWIIQGADIPTLAANIAKAKIVGTNQGMTVPPGWNSAESMDNYTLPEGPGGSWGGTSCANFSAANLSAAITQWNTDCAAGKGDTVFGRTAATMAPISTPPYYAIALWPAGPNTNGGPIRNEKSQVCDPYYKAIPRLYSGGELGSVWGFLYQGGGNITESICFGRIAGNNAAAEIPWTS